MTSDVHTKRRYKPAPIDILRKFVLRNCIEHLVQTSEECVWFNLTFWENIQCKAYAAKRWDRLSKRIVKRFPNFRFVGVWARQQRGAWHIHGVCNQRFDIEWFKSQLAACGFGPQCFLKKLDNRPNTPRKIARYISNYCTDKNGLDKEKDKGVRRMIFVGKHVRIMDMRYKSALKQITSIGRDIAESAASDEWNALSEFRRYFNINEGRKKAWETWGDWYRRNRDYWFRLGWETLTDEVRKECLQMDEFCSAYFETGRWSYV